MWSSNDMLQYMPKAEFVIDLKLLKLTSDNKSFKAHKF